MAVNICPECLAGKHVNCTKTTLNTETDTMAACECAAGAKA